MGGFSNSIPGSSLSQNVMLWRCVLYMNAYQNMCVDIMNQQPNMDPSPRTNDVLTPGACQALLTYTFILWDSPIRLQLLFLILHCLRHQSIQSIGHYNSDLTLGMSREFTFNRVSADILLALYSPMHSIHKSRLPSIPNALRLTKRQIKKRNVEYCR